MSRKFSKRNWYVHYCDIKTRRFLMTSLNLRDFFDETVEDFDSLHQKEDKNLDLVQLHSYDEVQYLKKNKKGYGIKFKIFVQDYPEGKIYRWSHDH